MGVRKYCAIRARSSAFKHQFAFARITRERCRALKLRTRLGKAAKPSQQIPAHARQEVIARKRSFREQRINDFEACGGTKSHGNRYAAIQVHTERGGDSIKCPV